MIVTLYSKQDCHLCDQVIELIKPFLNDKVALNIKDISQDPALSEHYGLIIPVLEFENGQQLSWPFSKQQIQQQLNSPLTDTSLS